MEYIQPPELEKYEMMDEIKHSKTEDLELKDNYERAIKIIKAFENYQTELNRDIENLKANNGYKDEKKVQVVSTLRDVLLRLEMIMDIK